MDSVVSFYDASHKSHSSQPTTYKQLSNHLHKKAPKIKSVADKIKKWKKHDLLAKRKVLLKFDSLLRGVIIALKKSIKAEFNAFQVVIGKSLLSIWESSLSVIKEVSANETSESMYKIILTIMNRSEFQPHHTVISKTPASNDVICLAEDYRKMLYATYIHISDVYESYEDLLMASFRVEMTDDPMKLTSEQPEEDVMDSATAFNHQDRPKPFPFHAQEGIDSVPIMTKILFGLPEKKKQLKKEKKDKKDKNENNEPTSLPEDAYFNQSGLSAQFLRFAPNALVMLYFQLPSFQELFLSHLSEFPDNNNVYLTVKQEQLESAKRHFPRLFSWTEFHNYVKELGIDEQEDNFDSCGDTWLDLYHPGNDIFLYFYSQLVDSLYHSFLSCKISWAAVPGFTEITNVYLSEFYPPRRRHNLRVHKQTMKQLALLSPSYLSAITGLLLKSTNIFDFEAVVDVLSLIAKLHNKFADHSEIPNPHAYALLHPIDSDDSSDDVMLPSLNDDFLEVESEHPADSTISAEELMILLERLIDSDNCNVILSALSALFYLLHICCISARTVVLKYLVTTWFDKLFLHWCSDVRKGFMHVLFYKGTINRRSHLNWDRFSKEENKINDKILQDTKVDLKEFDRNFACKLDKRIKTIQECVENEQLDSIPIKKRVYIVAALKEYNLTLKQYTVWDKKNHSEVPPVKTDIFYADDSY
ncbi:Uncharacterized protein QTN25_008322 [Entamoeba marina]